MAKTKTERPQKPAGGEPYSVRNDPFPDVSGKQESLIRSRLDPSEAAARIANANDPTDATLKRKSKERKQARIHRTIMGVVGLLGFVALIFEAFGDSVSLSLQLLIALGVFGPTFAILAAALVED
jgi:hypothetical protein